MFFESEVTARRDGYTRSGLITPKPWDFTVTNEGVSGTVSLP